MTKRVILFLVVGIVLSAFLFYVGRLYVHSVPGVKWLLIVVLLPFTVLSYFGNDIGDFAFWTLFWILQALYLLTLYWIIRLLIRATKRSG